MSYYIPVRKRGGARSAVKEERRNEFGEEIDYTREMLEYNAKQKAYERYKRRQYCYLFLKIPVFFLLGVLLSYLLRSL